MRKPVSSLDYTGEAAASRRMGDKISPLDWNVEPPIYLKDIDKFSVTVKIYTTHDVGPKKMKNTSEGEPLVVSRLTTESTFLFDRDELDDVIDDETRSNSYAFIPKNSSSERKGGDLKKDLKNILAGVFESLSNSNNPALAKKYSQSDKFRYCLDLLDNKKTIVRNGQKIVVEKELDEYLRCLREIARRETVAKMYKTPVSFWEISSQRNNDGSLKKITEIYIKGRHY